MPHEAEWPVTALPQDALQYNRTLSDDTRPGAQQAGLLLHNVGVPGCQVRLFTGLANRRLQTYSRVFQDG